MRRDQTDDDELSVEDEKVLREALDLDKPPLITKPGRYRMRNGMLAQISKTSGTFPYSCIGTRESPFGAAVSGMWAPSGRFSATPDQPYDIVEKVS